MTILRSIVHVQMRGLGALVAFGACFATVMTLLSFADGHASRKLLEIFGISFGASFVIGVSLVLLYGAPAYVFVARRFGMTWPRVLFLGALPGLAIATWMGLAGLTWAAFGSAVAVLTHVLVRSAIDASGL